MFVEQIVISKTMELSYVRTNPSNCAESEIKHNDFRVGRQLLHSYNDKMDIWSFPSQLDFTRLVVYGCKIVYCRSDGILLVHVNDIIVENVNNFE